MSMNESKGNMYDFVTHTWNTVKGECPHGCTYCYMKRWGKQRAVYFDKREMKTDLGEGNFIFVGSSCDLFANAIPFEWISKTLEKCRWAEKNQYLFQSKNPARIRTCDDSFPGKTIVCTTIETNRIYSCMAHAPSPSFRAAGMETIRFPRYITIEPILDFDLEPLVELVKRCEPVQVNIGADSGRNGLPEPTAFQVAALIDELSKFTTIARKTNLSRLLA